MRGLLGGSNPLERAIANMTMAFEKEQIALPPIVVPFEDLLWKFKNSFDPKPIHLCERDELLEVVKSLLDHIRELERQLAVKDHAKDALVTLLQEETEKVNGINSSEYTGSSQENGATNP